MTCRDLLFNILYRIDPPLIHSLIIDSLDRLDDVAWPRDLPLHNHQLLRATFFILLNKDMELKELALTGIHPIVAPLDRRKAGAFFLSLEQEAIRPFLTKDTCSTTAFVDMLKHLYLAV